MICTPKDTHEYNKASAENNLKESSLVPVKDAPMIKLTKNNRIVNTCLIASENEGVSSELIPLNVVE